MPVSPVPFVQPSSAVCVWSTGIGTFSQRSLPLENARSDLFLPREAKLCDFPLHFYPTPPDLTKEQILTLSLSEGARNRPPVRADPRNAQPFGRLQERTHGRKLGGDRSLGLGLRRLYTRYARPDVGFTWETV